MKLFPFQEEGANFLAGRHRALLLDAPGLGKTVQSIKAAERSGCETHSVISPAVVVKQWRKEHVKLSNSHVVFEARSYESARNKGVIGNPHAITLDEIHYLGNPDSGRTRKILGSEIYGRDGAIIQSTRVWGLSGTPSPRDPFNLYPVMLAVIPGSLEMTGGRTMGRWQFLKKFCVMKEFRKGQGFRVIKGKNLDELADRLAPFCLRRTKKDVFSEWKEPTVDVLWLDEAKAASSLQKAELTPEGQVLADIFSAEGFEGLQIFAETDSGISRLRRLTGLIKVPLATDWLVDQWESGMKKIVVMCYHREVIESLNDALQKKGYSGVIYWGGMTANQREKAKTDFILQQKDYFIGQIDACGTGLDGLQQATGRMLFVECSWIGDQNEQALARLDRIGQEEPVLGQFLALEGSLDAGIITVATRRTSETRTLFDTH